MIPDFLSTDLFDQVPPELPPRAVRDLVAWGMTTCHVCRRTIQRRLRQLESEGSIIRFGRGYVRAGYKVPALIGQLGQE
jgi:hypothetical protein